MTDYGEMRVEDAWYERRPPGAVPFQRPKEAVRP